MLVFNGSTARVEGSYDQADRHRALPPREGNSRAVTDRNVNLCVNRRYGRKSVRRHDRPPSYRKE
jgi:hypothetical protein